MSEILVLGFMSDANAIAELISSVTDVPIVPISSKKATYNHVRETGSPIPDTSFMTDIDNLALLIHHEDDALEARLEAEYHATKPPWSSYLTSDIALFVCSDLTQESSGLYASAKSDGAQFALDLLPETPRIILHYKSKHRNRRIDLPDEPTLQAYYAQGAYHLQRDTSTPELEQRSNKQLTALVSEILPNGSVPSDTYRRILDMS